VGAVIGKELELRVGPLMGWRCWRIAGPPEAPLSEVVPLRLLSVNHEEMQYPGDRGWATADCSRTPGHPGNPTIRPHSAPGEECSCGFYAYNTYTAALQHAVGTPGPSVVGSIELSGRVLVHELGYRAERARVVKVAFPNPRVDILKREIVEEGLRLGGYEVLPWGRTGCPRCAHGLEQLAASDTLRCPKCRLAVSAAALDAHGPFAWDEAV
jgi:hypothetical protein